MGNEQNVIKNFVSAISIDENDYNGYHEIQISTNEWFENLENRRNMKKILDRTCNLKQKEKEKNEQYDDEGIILNEIIENMNGFGVFNVKTNNYDFKKCKLCIETSSILTFCSFHDVIKSIYLEKKNDKYHYLISFIDPPKKTQFELFKYKIKMKHIWISKYLKIDYIIKRISKNSFDSMQILSDFQTFQTKMKTKFMDHKNKTKNIIFDDSLIWIEEYHISIESLFESMLSSIKILIPIRSLNNKYISSITTNSQLLKWGNIKQIKKGKMHFIEWMIPFIKGNAKHSVNIQITMIANNKKTMSKLITNDKLTNYNDNHDPLIDCSWNKHYFAVSGMNITRCNTHSFIKRNTNCDINICDDDDNDDDDDKYDEYDLNKLKTMPSSIITLDRRERLNINWNCENNVKFIKNEIYIDVAENEYTGIVSLRNNIDGINNVFRFSILMKDELLSITQYNECIVLAEYALQKTNLGYCYVYLFYSFALPYGESMLFKYKRLQNKKQSLIQLSCTKYVSDNDECTASYRFTLNSQFPSINTANNIEIRIPIYEKNIKIKNVSSSLLQKGNLKYMEKEKYLEWNIDNFKGNTQITRNVQFKLMKSNNEKNELLFGECHIKKMEIPDFTLSRIIISRVKTINNTKLKYDVWIRYSTIISNSS